MVSRAAWAQTGPAGATWTHVGPYGPTWAHMVPQGFIRAHRGPRGLYGSNMDSKRSFTNPPSAWRAWPSLRGFPGRAGPGPGPPKNLYLLCGITFFEKQNKYHKNKQEYTIKLNQDPQASSIDRKFPKIQISWTLDILAFRKRRSMMDQPLQWLQTLQWPLRASAYQGTGFWRLVWIVPLWLQPLQRVQPLQLI